MIKVGLANDDQLKIRIISGAKFGKDLARLQKIPTYREEFRERDDGITETAFYALPREDLQELLAVFKSSEMLLSEQVEADRRLYYKLLDGCDPDASYKGKLVPFGIITELKEHQDRWCRRDWSVDRMFNDMIAGGGKTISSLVRLFRKGAKRVLVVTVNNAWLDWKKDILKLFPGEPPLEYKGSPSKRKHVRRQVKDHRIVLAGYTLAGELNGEMFDGFIFDEQDLLANPETQRCKNLESLFNSTWAEPNNQVIVQTATMVGNTPSTAYMAFRLIHPLLSGSFACFKARHQVAEQWEYKSFPVKGPDGVVRWATRRHETKIRFAEKDKLIETFKNYASDSEVVFPFRHIKQVQMVEMTDQQREVFDELKENLESYIGQRHIKIKQIRNKTMRLLQASEGLFNFDEDVLESGKLDYIVDYLKRTKRKVIIWSRFRKITEILQKLFPDQGVMYNGLLTEPQRRINRFAFNGVSSVEERKEYRTLLQAHEFANDRKNDRILQAYRDAIGDPGAELEAFELPKFKAGDAQFLFGIMHNMTSRAVNFEAGELAMISSLTFSDSALKQTISRHARINSKYSRLWTKHVLSVDSGEVGIKDFVENRCKQMQLTAGGDEKLNLTQAKEIAKLFVKGDTR